MPQTNLVTSAKIPLPTKPKLLFYFGTLYSKGTLYNTIKQLGNDLTKYCHQMKGSTTSIIGSIDYPSTAKIGINLPVQISKSRYDKSI